MKRIKLLIIITISFLLGGIVTYLFVQQQVQQSHNRDLLLGYTLQALQLDESAIAEDTNVIRSLGGCLSNLNTCDFKKVSQLGIQYKQDRERLTTQQNVIHTKIQILSK